MRILGWMHRKFRQNSGDPLKDFSVGNSSNCFPGWSSLDEHYQSKTPFPQNVGKQKDQFLYRNSFTGGFENDNNKEEEEETISEIFTNWQHGFLAIGTLGSDVIENETQIPHFDLENITEKETDVTENDVKLINDELEKVLGEEVCESRRNSHVSVTAKLTENGENQGQVCPLQGYLFGSPIDLPRVPEKREHRVSLGELFLRAKAAEQCCVPENKKSGRNEGVSAKNEEKKGSEGEKSGVHLVKKMLKGRTASRQSTVDSVAAENKLQKLLHMFQRKVHPESSITSKKSTKANTKVETKSVPYVGDIDDNEGQLRIDDALILPQRTMRKGGIWHYKYHSNTPPFALGGNDSTGNREYWIKTDADYLVLEL